TRNCKIISKFLTILQNKYSKVKTYFCENTNLSK
ncbi:MAG: hypothetical protein ACI848_001179, partial [Roseivirga sp.]